MAEEAQTPTPTTCSFVKRGGTVCNRSKQAGKPFCYRCNDLINRRAGIPRYNAPHSIEPPTKAKCVSSTIANAPSIAALPTDSMIPNSEINAKLVALQEGLDKLTNIAEELKERVEEINDRLDHEIYRRRRDSAICFSKLGIVMPHRMHRTSPPSFIVNPIGDLPDSPNHITLSAPKSPKPKGKPTKRQLKLAEKLEKHEL